MEKMNVLNRIVIDPQVMGGKPVIKGTRLTVQYILGLLAQDMSFSDILQEYTTLRKEDILACCAFAQKALDSSLFAPLSINNK